MSTFETRLADTQAQMETVLDKVLPLPEGPQAQIMHAVRYASLGGGKRLRPFLLLEAASMFGAEGEGALLAAAALECVHVYSLIHDDLPCMDDDDVRRGKPTVHKAYDEAMGVLAGDALLTLAFEIMAHEDVHQDAGIRVKLISGLAKASGSYGMIGGQVIDIYAPILLQNQNQDEEFITRLQALKTGALIRYAAMAGGLLSEASAEDLQNLDDFASALGLVFQITDDILDREGDAAEMGKATRKDDGLGKATFVSIYGLDGAKKHASDIGQQAKQALASYGSKADTLCACVDFVLNRKK